MDFTLFESITDTLKCNTENADLLLISMVRSDSFTQFNQQLETDTQETLGFLMLAGQIKIVHLFLF